MTKHKKLIILFTIIALLVISIITAIAVYLIKLNNDTKLVPPEENISYPVSFSTSNNLFNSDFYKSYQNDSIKLSTSFSLTGNDISRYSYYNFTIDKTIPFQMILVNSTSFKNQEDLYQRMYMYESPTGDFIEKYSYEENDLKIDMAIMEPAIGGKSYMIIGGIIDGNKGYYFKIMLGGALTYNITADRISNIVKFSDERNPHIIFDLIQKFKSEDIPLTYFVEFIPTTSEVNFNKLGKTGNFDLPVYQNRS